MAAQRCLEQSIFDETIDQWRRRHRACVHAKGGHFQYRLWTDNVDVVHICYVKCELFHYYVCNCEIIPAKLTNTHLFILQGRYSGRFRVRLVTVNVCLQQELLKSDSICQSYAQMKKGPVFWLTVYIARRYCNDREPRLYKFSFIVWVKRKLIKNS